MSRRRALGWMACAIAAATSACYDPLYGAPLDGADSAGPAVPTDVGDVFARNCAGSGCHVGGSVAPSLGYASIVEAPSRVDGVVYVAPGDPDASYLYAKCTGSQASLGGDGSAMPLGGILSEEDLETLRAWIADGAAAE